MIPINPQTIRSASGEELVVLTRAEFDALTAAASDAMEDADDAAVFDERMAAISTGVDAKLPAAVSTAMLNGFTLLRAIRRWKKVTQGDLALRTGLAQGYISDIETGRKTGTVETLRSIADALEINRAWLAVD